jgi:hypothetical protein
MCLHVQAVPAVLLGALRPKALLVTTPNVEYNAVIGHVTKKRSPEVR